MQKFSIKERTRSESITTYMTRIARTTPSNPDYQTFDQWVSQLTHPQ